MKKSIFFTVMTLSMFGAKAQESSAKLKLHAASLGVGIFGVDMSNHDGGLTFLADATFSVNKNLISASCLFGSEINLFDERFDFKEPALMYGREWNPSKWFALEGFAGVGYYIVEYKNADTDFSGITDNAISFPLRLNAKFYFTKKFGMGLCSNYSINNLANTFSENLTFHYKFN